MNLLHQYRHSTCRAQLTPLLIVLLLIQMAVPIQAHSHYVRSGGITVLLCTLQGNKTVEIHADGRVHSHPAPSAAMQFSDLLKDFSPTQALPPRVDTRYTLAVVLQQTVITPIRAAQTQPKSRGPPISEQLVTS